MDLLNEMNKHELKEIIETTFQLVRARFMKFDFTFPLKNLCRGQFNHCFAYEGIKKSGFNDFCLPQYVGSEAHKVSIGIHIVGHKLDAGSGIMNSQKKLLESNGGPYGPGPEQRQIQGRRDKGHP